MDNAQTLLDGKKRVMLLYPPGRLYQRGEDRSQGNVEDSTATSIRACNDLGYAASTLKAVGYEVFLRDYQTERLGMDDLVADFRAFSPHMLFISITNATIFRDIEVVAILKEVLPSTAVILKGALFFDPEDGLLDQLDLRDMDYLLGGESDFVSAKLVDAHFKNKGRLKDIKGILYREDGAWQRTEFSSWESDLDSLPFPDRSLMNNTLYTRPDTGEMQATIATSRGCAAPCIYCLTPIISGRKVRLRSPENIFMEIRETYEKYGIRDFFFKSDTFTIRAHWVDELCRLIIKSDLNGKIEWVANSRVTPLKQETLTIMKEAGCWLVAFGYESGSPETLEKIKKGAMVEDNIRAAEYARKARLQTFGFFLIGLPWEDMSHLEDTRRLIYTTKPDFLEIHIAVPYYGTPLYDIAKAEGLIEDTVLGKDYFNTPTTGTKYLKMSEIMDFKRRVLLQYHLRPSYIIIKTMGALSRPRVLLNYFRFGMKLLWRNL